MGRLKKGKSRRTPVRFKGDDYIPEIDRARWVEYGTLVNRDPMHTFRTRRGRKSARWKGGIKPVRATERAWQATASTVIGGIPREVTRQADSYDRRNGR